MNENNEGRLCSMMNCARQSVTSEEGRSERWRFVVYYCDEHRREVEKGVPVGPMGVDPARTSVLPIGTTEMLTGSVKLGAD